MKKIFLPILMLASTSLFAQQIKVAPEIGVNMSNYTAKVKGLNGNVTSSGKYQIGGRAGLALDIGINDNFSIQPGVFYNLTRFANETNILIATVVSNTTIHGIQVPVNFLYHTTPSASGSFFGGIGPVFTYYISGTTKSGNSSSDLSFGNSKDDNMKALDIAGGITAGYELSSGAYLRAYYHIGFSNLIPESEKNDSNSLRSSSFGLSIGYFF